MLVNKAVTVMNIGTCRDCKERKPACHSTCEKYKQGVEKIQGYKDREKENRHYGKGNYKLHNGKQFYRTSEN